MLFRYFDDWLLPKFLILTHIHSHFEDWDGILFLIHKQRQNDRQWKADRNETFDRIPCYKMTFLSGSSWQEKMEEGITTGHEKENLIVCYKKMMTTMFYMLLCC